MQLYKYYSPDAIRTVGLHADILTEEQGLREYLDNRANERKGARKHIKALVRRSKARGSSGRPRRQAKATPEIKWLRELICPFVYAEKTPDGVRPSVTKEAFIGRWNMRLGLPSLPNYKMLDHFQGEATLYFMAHGWERTKHILVMIDIDVLKSKGLGTPQGARKFAEHLKTIWPDLYFETSTNGHGIHGYFILRKGGADAKQTNAALKRLERWLRAKAKKVNADIEEVEIKGTCLDLTLDGKFAQAVKFGVPAKLPRDVARFAEWQQTTVLRVQDLEGSQYDEREDEAVGSESVAVNDEPETVIQWPVAKPVKSAKLQKQAIVAGSVSNKFINEEELAAIPAFERLYREWVGPNDLMAGKFRVTAQDFAVAMVMLRHFKDDPSWNGSLPVRRAEKLWKGLKDAGDTDRGWNHHRWKAVRDFLSARGHIDWTDHRYEIPTVVKDENGNKDEQKSRRGLACKWAITDEYDYWLRRVALLTGPNAGGASSVDTEIRKVVAIPGKGKNLRPTLCSFREQRFWQRASEACDLLFAA